MTTPEFTRRELAHRASAGIEVSLFWMKVGDMLTIEIHDTRSNETFTFEAPRDRALDAFRHPFAYLAAAETRAEQAYLQAA